MRFVCDSCRAQYMISDEKVGPKGVKVRCKKCSYVILVKKSDGGGKSPVSSVGADADDALATQVMQNPLTGPGETAVDATNPGFGDEKTQAGAGGGFFSGVDEDEIGAVFDQVLSSGPHAMPKAEPPAGAEVSSSAALGDDPDDRLSTRVMDAATVNQLATESNNGDSEAPISGEAEKPAGAAGEAAPEWFAAIDDKQTGPLSIEKLKEHWNRGEVGPDSLAWKAGMPDWIPISEIAELSAELAPRPKQPVLVAPTPAVSAPGPVVNVPVESAFSAGGGMAMASSGGGMQVPLGTGEEVASWRPSAASALASLVKEEMDALNKPSSPAMMSDAAVASPGGGLLDLPSPDAPAPRTNGHSDSAGSSRPAPANPYIASSAPTYSSPAIAQYRPPPEKDNKMLFIFGGLALVVVLLVGIGVIVSLNRQPVAPVVVAPPVQPAPVAAPAPAPTPAPVAAQPTQAQPTPAAPAQAQPGAPTPAPTPAPAVAPTPVAPTPVAAAPRPTGTFKTGGEKTSAPKAAKEEKPVDAPAAGKKGKEEVDDFDAAFGGETKSTKKTEKPPEKEAQSEPKRPATYIPPAPGGGNIPDELTTSDITGVVLESKPALATCIGEQKKKDPALKGTVVIEWQIQTSGKTGNIKVVTEEFKGTPIATCLGGVIKGMNFPKHKKQGQPTKFPFKF
jgi:predicted Zn finger-like uncharacterized protein